MPRGTAPSSSRRLFARHLRRLRKATGMTLDDLSEKTGLSRNYLSTVECAKGNISLDNMDRIAQALGVALYAMLVPCDEDDTTEV